MDGSNGAADHGRATARSRDAQLAQLAGRQHGVVSRSQLLALPMTARQIQGRLGRVLWRLGPGIYAVGHPGVSRLGRATAALLHVGEFGALSHLSSARLWGLVGRAADGPIHASVAGRTSLATIDGVVLHRPRRPLLADIVSHRGLRVTTPERTVLDLLATSSVYDVTRMLEQMVTMLGRSPDDLLEWAAAVHHVPSRTRLDRALDEIAGPKVIRSELESLFRSVCQEGGLPGAETNALIGRWEVDALWPEHRVAVELDSWRFHGGRGQFHRDRTKGLAISRAGYELLRVTWPQLKHHRAEVTETIRLALARRESTTTSEVDRSPTRERPLHAPRPG